MTSTTCAFCGHLSHMKRRWAAPYVNSTDGTEERGIQGVLTCDHCGRASLATALTEPGVIFSETRAQEILEEVKGSLLTWYPSEGQSPKFPDVPETIARAAREAHATASINCQMAAVLMARTVVEATAKAKSITTGRLWAKIDAMADQNIIRTSTKEAAHEIRHFGNDMAHGDIEQVPSAEDVKDVLILMDEILSEVFQGPARTERLKSRRSTPQS